MNDSIIEFEGMNIEATCNRLSCFIMISGYTDKQLAQALNTSVQSVNKWRHAHNLPDIDNMYSLSRIFGVTLDDLIVPLDDSWQKIYKRNQQSRRICDYICFLKNLIKKKTLSGGIKLPDQVRDYCVNGINLSFC